MCYIVLLGTTSDEDLARHNTTLLHFTRDIPTTGAATVEATALRHPHRWYVGSSAGCSCSFRHLYSVELGFSEPEDWYPEEAEDIQATLQFIQVVRALVAEGHAVACIDAWEHAEMLPNEHEELLVALSSIRDSEFRFFENHHFVFCDAA